MLKMRLVKGFINPINIVIFSKDRACQLDLFLTSMETMFKEYTKCDIHVLYLSSSEEYEKAYRCLKREHTAVKLWPEDDFRNDVLALIDASRQFTVFFVDDIVWKEPFSLKSGQLRKLEENPELLCLSLRLDPSLNYCYALDIPMIAPQFDDDLIWEWSKGEGDFGYPMSLDGHVFRTMDILPLVETIKFSNPNTLEGNLAHRPLVNTRMICYPSAPIFNIPINKVQNLNSNRHGNISNNLLNNWYLDGYRINYKPLQGYGVNGCHQEVDIQLTRPPHGIFKRIFR